MHDMEISSIIIDEIKKAHDLGKIPAFAYDRVSDEGQTLGISLEFQEYQAKKYADDKNLYIVYYFTKVESAWKKGRKVFNSMLYYAQKFKVKDLLFKNVDRMSRNWEDLTQLRELYEHNEFNLHFYLNSRIINRSSNYEDKSILELEIWVAKRSSDRTSHMVKAANLYKVEKGVMPGRPPVGYIFDNKLKKHLIDPDKKTMLNYIFDTFDNTQISVRDLTELVNLKGHRTSTNRKWSPSRIHAVLINPFYHGEFRYADKTWLGDHEKYYSKNRFETRMDILNTRDNGARKRNFDFILSNFLSCEGKALTGEMKKGRYVYYTNRFTQKSFREETLLEMIDNAVNEIQFSDEFAQLLKNTFRESVRLKTKDETMSESAISAEISKLKLRKAQLIELFLDQDIDREALKTLNEKYEQDIQRFEEDLKRTRLNKDEFVYKISDVIDSIYRLPALYKTSSNEDKIELIRKSATGIEVFDDNVRINWDLPFGFILNNEVMPYAGMTSEEVRKVSCILPEQDTFRTIVYRKSFEAQLWFAAKIA